MLQMKQRQTTTPLGWGEPTMEYNLDIDVWMGPAGDQQSLQQGG